MDIGTIGFNLPTVEGLEKTEVAEIVNFHAKDIFNDYTWRILNNDFILSTPEALKIAGVNTENVNGILDTLYQRAFRNAMLSASQWVAGIVELYQGDAGKMLLATGVQVRQRFSKTG